LCALLVFVLAQIDTSIQSVEEAQKLLNLKVLAGIPTHEPPEAHTAKIVKSVFLGLLAVVYAVGVVAFLFQETISALLRKGS